MPSSPYSNHTISSDFVRAHLNNGLRLGLDRQRLLEQAEITEPLLEPNARLSARQLAKLLRSIMVTANDEFLGCSNSPVKFGVFSLLCERLIHCKTLFQALKETQNFYRLTSDNLTFSIIEQGNEVALRIQRVRPELDTQNLLIELLMLVWHRFPSWLVGEVIPITQVRLTYPSPEQVGEYRLLFPCHCQFEAPYNELVWPKAILQQPIHRTPEQLQSYLQKVPAIWFRKPRFADDYTDRVNRCLKQTESIQTLTLTLVAAQLHTTARTLRRKLTQESSSFQRLKDNIRRDRAIHWLSQTAVTITQAAQHCGYTETAAFTRAFKGWTGIAPGIYRRQLHSNLADLAAPETKKPHG